MAKKEKQPIHRVQMTEGKRNIIRQLLQEYDIETAEDIQDALKDLLGGTIKEMMEAEMDDHLGYQKSELFFASLFWRKLQNVFGENCISILVKVAAASPEPS